MSQLSLSLVWSGWIKSEIREFWPVGSGWRLCYTYPDKMARIVEGIAYTYLVLDRGSSGFVWEFLHLGIPGAETLALADRALDRLLAESSKIEIGGSACLAS
jgi:hypothetical protein